MTTSMTEVKYFVGNRPADKPEEAIIKATSPRDTMPDPTASDSCKLNPVSLAPMPPPTNLVTIATSVSSTMNII
ncbi:hypothetical protein D3C81_1736940 [compost metagenome]